MNVLQVMGCTSDQYASMERYLVRKAEILSRDGSRLVVVYESIPRSAAFVEELLAAGGILRSFRLRGVADFSFYRQIRALIGKHGIHIVHGYFTPTNYYLALALHASGFRTIVRTAANMPFGLGGGGSVGVAARPTLVTCLKHRVLALLFRKILCRSEGVREAFRQLGVPASRLAVADGGCDTQRYEFSCEARARLRGELGIADEEIVLGVCCRLVPVKHLDRLVRLVACADGLGAPAVRLLVAGDGPEREHLESLARDPNASGRIRFLGHRDDLPELYSAFDVFCLPSEAEGMSNSILEAMACRLPVLASDIAPNRALVRPGENGYLIAFRIPDEFAGRLRNLSSPGARRRMGEVGRDLVERKFSLDSRIRKEMEAYREVLERP